jgi:hypothetical protein
MEILAVLLYSLSSLEFPLRRRVRLRRASSEIFSACPDFWGGGRYQGREEISQSQIPFPLVPAHCLIYVPDEERSVRKVAR